MQLNTLTAAIQDAQLKGRHVHAEIKEAVAGGKATLTIFADGELIGFASSARAPDSPRA